MGNYQGIEDTSNTDYVTEHIEDISSRFHEVRAEAGYSLIPDSLDAASQLDDTELRDWSPQLLRSLSNEFKEVFERLKYVGPLRQKPSRRYQVSGHETVLNEVGSAGQYTPEVMFLLPEKVQQETNTWFEKFDIPYKIDIEHPVDIAGGGAVIPYLTELNQDHTLPDNPLKVSPVDVGVGIGQLLPIIVQGVLSNQTDPNIICVEQPEIHLHPKLQANLADFFIQTSRAQDTSTEKTNPEQGYNQWIIETHSEALIQRLLRRVRGGEIDPEEISVLYVQRDDQGQSNVSRLRIDPDGTFIDQWPQGFFEENIREMLDDVHDLDLNEQEQVNKDMSAYLEHSENSQDEV
jgi:hypothetical protein